MRMENFSLLYRGTGTENLEVRLALLYDVVGTVAIPRPSRDMAMRIGDEYSSEKVMAKNFEQLAEEAGLGKPLVRGRVVGTARKGHCHSPKTEIPHPVAQKVAALIRRRSEKAVSRFGN